MSSPQTASPAAVELVDGVDIDAVAAAVRACAGVADLSGGRIGEVATYLPGRRVAGIRVRDDAVEVHVTVPYGPSVDEVAGQVRRAVRPLVGQRAVDVGMDDIALEPPPEPETPAGAPDISTGTSAGTLTTSPATTIDPGGATAPREITMPPAPPRVR